MPHYAAGTQGVVHSLAEHAALLDGGAGPPDGAGRPRSHRTSAPARRRHFAAALRRFPHKGRSVEEMVTGCRSGSPPAYQRRTPMLNVEALLPAVSHESLIQGDGRVRFGGAGKAGAAGGGVRVQGELGHHQQGTACLPRFRFILPFSSSKDPQVADFLRQAVGGLPSVSLGPTPSSTRKPRPIRPLTFPAMVTEAPATRVTTARIQWIPFYGSLKMEGFYFCGNISHADGRADAPPFSFVSAKRERAAPGIREKRFGRNFTHACKVAVRGRRERACVFARVPDGAAGRCRLSGGSPAA